MPLQVRHRFLARKSALVRGIVLVPLLAATLAPLPLPVHAQEAAPPHTSRTKLFTILGAVLGGVAGLAVAKGSQSSNRHGCLGVPCVFVGSVVIGAGIGFAIGHESDRQYVSRFRGVASLHPASTNADLEGDPTALAADDRSIAVGGSVGVQVLDAAGAMQSAFLRARGLSGISTVGLSPNGWLAVGSPEGLYMFPPQAGPGALVRAGSVAAIVSGPEHVYVAVNDRIEIVPLADDTTRDWPGVTLESRVHALALDSARSLLWATTDRDLIAFRASGDSLTRVGATPLDAVGLSMALAGDTIAIALGERGIRLFDATNAAAPHVVASWSIAHFAYDVSLDAHRLFVAAGPEGVYVIDIGTSPLRTIGLARSLGFATALASRRGYTYILDRRSVVLRRVLSDF
ncbi:MAG: hypothetical protein ACREND_18620 [Gemmatimonadaceae bacterium]